MAKREEIVNAAAGIIRQYEGMRLTLRQIYYRLVAGQIMENRVSNYKALSDILARAREAGAIPWGAIEDRTREIHDGYGEEITAGARFRRVWNLVENLDSAYTMLAWWGQPTKVFVLLEKEALYEVFRQVTDVEGVDLVPLRGYSSVTLLKDAAERLQAFGEASDDLRILYFGDFDPSGENIQDKAEEKIREYGADFELERIREWLDGALNPDFEPPEED